MARHAMTETETREYQSVVLASLLHDVGKLLHRRDDATYGTGHHKVSSRFIKDHAQKLKNDTLYDLDLVDFLALHHMAEREEKKENVLSDPFCQSSTMDKERVWRLVTIVRDADAYSCTERARDQDEQKRFAYRLEPLRPIFQNIDLSPQGPSPKDGLNYRLNVLDPMKCFPARCDSLTDQEFGRLIDEFEKAIPDFSQFIHFDDVINQWVDILQRFMSCVPCDTRYDGPDVSLYDHSRSSAAFGACLYQRRLESLRQNQQFKRDNEFMLIGGDYSGIQNYIFHITNRGSGGASKRLRARSFFVYLFSEATIHKILHALDLPLVCNLFSAGGKFLLLAPNIEGVADILQQAKAEINSEISGTYFNQFSFLLAWMEFNGGDKKKRPSDFKIYSFYKAAEDMFHRLETEKFRKFQSVLVDGKSQAWSPAMFKATRMYEKYTEAGDCKICGRGPGIIEDIDPDTDEVTMCCPVCHRDKFQIGQVLPKARFIAFGKGMIGPDEGDRIVLFHSPSRSSDAIPSDGYYAQLLQTPQLRPDHYLVYKLSSRDDAVTNTGRQPILRKFYANHVPVKENRILSFEGIAEKSLRENDGSTYGSDLLGVLKVDVDNLGLVFSKGFEKPSRLEKGYDDIDRKTVSRFLTLSRMMELFFSGWISDIMEADKEAIIGQLIDTEHINREDFGRYLRSAAIDFKNIYTVYSGGDDLVLVGPWETMIVFALHMSNEFRKYTCNNDYVTLSAGLAFIKNRQPIATAIKQADALLERSKRGGKNSISLFDTTICWNQFPKTIDFFLFLDKKINGDSSEITTAFLHKLLFYHQTAMRFHQHDDIEGLKYLAALSYDIGRNIIKRDKEGNITRGLETSDFLKSNLIDANPRDKNAPIYILRMPVTWCLYRNRRS